MVSNNALVCPADFEARYRGSRVLITGGLGFIGSNLAVRLAQLGARVAIVDSEVEGCGANRHNIASIASEVELIERDIADAGSFRALLAECAVIFNTAGEISHQRSMLTPQRDASINAIAQLQFLSQCAEYAPSVRIVYAGTRQIYGAPRYLPVDEDHPANPIDFNGVHKRAAMMYHLLYAQQEKLDAVVLNLTNVYGPRMALNVPNHGFLSTYVLRAALREPLEIYGDGLQLRDPVFVDDVVQAFLIAGAVPGPPSRVYNVGGPSPLPIRQIAETLQRAAGLPPATFRAFTPEQKSIDIGSFYTDTGRIRRELGWTPMVEFEAGIRKTLTFYEEELEHYAPSRKAPLRRVAAGAD